MAKVTKIPYCEERLPLISEENLKKYQKYLQSNIIKNKDVKETTYKTYQNFFNQFLVYLAESWDNVDLYSEEFMDNAVDIMEGFIAFCQETLQNHKKVINTKLSAVSSFYIWSTKRGYIKYHPFQGKLDRMKGASEEKILNSYFLTETQVETIRNTLKEDSKFDIQDQLLFEIAYNSANRLGALSKLTLTSLNLEDMMFEGIREKEGYIVEVVFENYAKELLEEWLEIRKSGYDFLKIDSPFISLYDGEYHPMKRGTIHNHMRKYGEIINIVDFRTHCMRKSKLNNVYEDTGDLTLAAELANHKSTETTRSSYIKPKTKSEVRDKINKLREEKEKDKLTDL